MATIAPLSVLVRDVEAPDTALKSHPNLTFPKAAKGNTHLEDGASAILSVEERCV